MSNPVVFCPDPSNRWGFIFPHPDDEIAIIGWMSWLVSHGIAVSAIWMHSTPIREAESRVVMARAGVSDLTFLQAPDGELTETWRTFEPELATWLRSRVITHPVTVAYEQGHLDHDVTNWLVNRNAGVPVREVPLYHPYSRKILRANTFAGQGNADTRALSSDDFHLKCSLLSSYPSQRIGSILRTYRAVHRLLGNPDPFRTEKMRIQTWTDFAAPNHADPLRQEILKSPRWSRWITAIKDVD